MKLLTAVNKPSRSPLSCVPPALVGIKLTKLSRTGAPSSVNATHHRCALAFGKALAARRRQSLPLQTKESRGRPSKVASNSRANRLCTATFGFLWFFRPARVTAHARHQHRFAAQQMGQFGHRQSGCFKVFGINPYAHGGARFAVTLSSFANLQRLRSSPAQTPSGHGAFAVAGGF